MKNIRKRCKAFSSKEEIEEIFGNLPEIPLGSEITALPKLTKKLMKNLTRKFPEKTYRKILAGNNHQIPKEAFLKEKIFFEKANSLEEYLKQRHQRKVEILQKHCDENRVWFEQIITQEVVDFVNSNPEILSAVMKDEKLFVTKIPYDTLKYLNAKKEKEKRYHACHCSFARTAILDDEMEIPSDWCYCSAGFAKFPFEIILGEELEVKVVKSVLAGDEVCRFAIELPKNQ